MSCSKQKEVEQVQAIKLEEEPTFEKIRLYFQVEGTGYFSKRDQLFPGQIWKRDGSWLNVQLIHKTLEDYFNCLRIASFKTMPIIKELRVTSEHVALDESFFSPLLDLPLHLAIQVSK